MAEQETILSVLKDVSENNRIRECRSLMRQLCVDRIVGKEVLRTTMGKIWVLSKPATFTEVGKNYFNISFNTEADKIMVMSGRSWLFDNNLLALLYLDGFSQPENPPFDTKVLWIQLFKLPAICMIRMYGDLIGKSIGKVIDIDVDTLILVGVSSSEFGWSYRYRKHWLRDATSQ